MNSFVKSHGLGNDYIVLDSNKISFSLTPNVIKKICDYHFGIGSDGILLKVPSNNADFGLKIFNPDGSEAEKSGNGLRIFSKYLFDYSFAKSDNFSVETSGGIVHSCICEKEFNKANLIKVEMGKAQFISKKIPVVSNEEMCLNQNLNVNGKSFKINCVSVGNPHCVIISDKIDLNETKTFGPLIEKNEIFPNKINVQFAKILSRNEVQILIWERGAGHTLASGSSSCAVACVCRKLGLIDKDVDIIMEGGILKISLSDDFDIEMTGEVKEVAKGVLSEEFVRELVANKE